MTKNLFFRMMVKWILKNNIKSCKKGEVRTFKNIDMEIGSEEWEKLKKYCGENGLEEKKLLEGNIEKYAGWRRKYGQKY